MAKLTRKSYKRKKIAFGAAILGGIALVSSGFAAFVLSANANKDAEGAVNVGKVINGSVAMELYYQNGSNYVLITDENKTNTGAFSFDAPESDVKKEGEVNRVYYKKIGDTKPETLSLAYKCSIESKTDSLASLNVKMTTVTSAGNDLNQAVTDGYVTLPSCLSNKGITATFTEGKETFTSDLGTGSNDNIAIKKTAPSGENTNYKWEIIYTVSFQWGARFAKKNPSLFFDSDDKSDFYKNGENQIAGKEVPLQTVDQDLNTMHTLLDGIKYTIAFEAIGA